jgi:glycosyltransferase involved in cell wall biosynthesis
MTDKIQIAIDGREANVAQRVGSNVYAFEILRQLSAQLKYSKSLGATVLLSSEPVSDLPEARTNWQYQQVKPSKMWTQWAEPWHLFWQRRQYDVLFVPGHYAPRLSPIPYVSSVMDLAFLPYPEQFRPNDLYQLKHWTRYSVKRAQKVVTISEFTKQEIQKYYGKPAQDIIVAYPDVNLQGPAASQAQKQAFWQRHQIQDPYFLFVGTLQPRKNLVRLIEAFEQFIAKLKKQDLKTETNAANTSKNQTSAKEQLPQLVIAGKIGWMAEPILEKIKQSPAKKQIITTGYVSQAIKKALLKEARALVLIGLYEGFGIPALEAMRVKTIPLVSDNSSLPEVVGPAGLTVDPEQTADIVEALHQLYEMKAKERATFSKKARKQVKKFNWELSAEKILSALTEVAQEN